MATHTSASEIPLRVEPAGALLEEGEPCEIGRALGVGVHVGVERSGEPVGGEQVHAAVADEGGSPATASRVHCKLGRRVHGFPRGAGAASARCCRCGAGQIEQVRPLGVIELERPGDRVKHAGRHPGQGAPLQLRVVLDAHPGQRRDLAAT